MDEKEATKPWTEAAIGTGISFCYYYFFNKFKNNFIFPLPPRTTKTN